jgi:hypothetical protein
MGTTYIGTEGAPDDDPYWCEGEPARFEIERTDDDEIRIGVQIRGDSSDSATLYVERSEAIRLVLAIAQAIGDR